jgi:hypothetical protein
MAAAPRTLSRLGEVERRWSYASWTAPSHYNLLMGLLPHSSPQQVYASEYYKRDFLRYNERLGVEHVEFKSLIPHLFLPTFLKRTLGYQTHARVSLPVLNPATPLNRDFDSFTLMPKHNDMAAMIDRMTFSPDRPSFYLLNVGETHYPYALIDEPPEEWPRISGVHGVFKALDAQIDAHGNLIAAKDAPQFFDQDKLDQLRAVHLNQQHSIRSQIHALPAEISQREEKIARLNADIARRDAHRSLPRLPAHAAHDEPAEQPHFSPHKSFAALASITDNLTFQPDTPQGTAFPCVLHMTGSSV